MGRKLHIIPNPQSSQFHDISGKKGLAELVRHWVENNCDKSLHNWKRVIITKGDIAFLIELEMTQEEPILHHTQRIERTTNE